MFIHFCKAQVFSIIFFCINCGPGLMSFVVVCIETSGIRNQPRLWFFCNDKLQSIGPRCATEYERLVYCEKDNFPYLIHWPECHAQCSSFSFRSNISWASLESLGSRVHSCFSVQPLFITYPGSHHHCCIFTMS